LNRSGVITLQDLPPKLSIARDDSETVNDLFGDLPSLEELGQRYLEYVLKVTGNNKSQAADILGVSRNTIYRMALRQPRHTQPLGRSELEELHIREKGPSQAESDDEE
jgi:transcriptional regulator of acetoin/glycerol metabolism